MRTTLVLCGYSSYLCRTSVFPAIDLPHPDVIAAEIVEDLEAALEQFREIAGDLGVEENMA